MLCTCSSFREPTQPQEKVIFRQKNILTVQGTPRLRHFVLVLKADQEILKVRVVVPHIGPIPIVIPPKLFLNLLRDPVFPRELTDSQSYVPIFTHVDS